MFGARDIFWAAIVSLVLSAVVYYRPLWGARAFLESEAEQGFRIAYDGHRFINGRRIISPQKSGAGHDDPFKQAVLRRGFTIKAERMAWNGASGEFVVRHVIRMADGSPAGEDLSRDMHVRLERVGNGWRYTHFRVRDAQPLPNLELENPFAVAARDDG